MHRPTPSLNPIIGQHAAFGRQLPGVQANW